MAQRSGLIALEAIAQPPERVLVLARALDARWIKSRSPTRAPEDFVGDDEAKQARAALAGISKDATQYAEAQKLIANLQRYEGEAKARLKRAIADNLADNVEGRKRFARELEEANLKIGRNVDVTTAGSKNTTLRFKYALVNKALEYKLRTETQFLQNAWGVGFTTVILTDGYDYEVTYRVKP